MSKKWEEEVTKELVKIINDWLRSKQDILAPLISDDETHAKILKLFAKQRTQLLARVREEVIGEVSYLEDALITNLKQEQLKKLEIISEEGK